MSTDMNVWQKLLKNAVQALADESLQRSSWFGIDGLQSSPTETFCQLLDDVDLKEYLGRGDTGLDAHAVALGKKLLDVMQNELPFEIRAKIPAVKLIDDPRMMEVRECAQNFLEVL